jgi:hypothetical protein
MKTVRTPSNEFERPGMEPFAVAEDRPARLAE